MDKAVPKRPKGLRLRTRATDFSFRGQRYRLSLNGPCTEKRSKRLAIAVNAFAQKQAQRKQQFVYFVQCDDRIKIGIARDPQRRLRTLQTGNAGELQLLAVVVGDMGLEGAIHAKFESSRIQGEWFVRSQELLEFVARLKKCDSVVFDRQTNDVRMMVRISRDSTLNRAASRIINVR